MKNPSSASLLLRPLLVATALAALAAAPARAEDDTTTATVNLSAPGQPATLRIEMPWADIKIVGVDGNTVTVESSLTQKGAKPVRADGLRRLDDEVTFELKEKDNVVSLRMAGDNPWASHDAAFKVRMPHAMALTVKTEAGGDLAVKNVDGDLDISNMNGDVQLAGITGSVIVNTMNGEVTAAYTKPPQKLVSITSMNGAVVLSVPADTKANVRLRTHNGAILTDFSDEVLKTKTEGSADGYGSGSNSQAIAHEAARAAAEATRAAVRIAREVGQAVKEEMDRAKQEEADADAAAAPSPAPTPVASVAPAPAAAPRAVRTPRPPIPPIAGGKTVTGTLNGGGVDLKVSTMNGEITLRQVK